MITNKRPMGETAGYFTGLEVERSQFYGEKTFFFSRFRTLVQKLQLVDDCPHVFIALINPRFWMGMEHAGSDANIHSLIHLVQEHLLAKGKKVTIEADVSWSTAFTELRIKYPKTFCLMIVVEVPLVEIGGFCIKAAPTKVFEDSAYERCVMTASFNQFKAGASYWEEYTEDKDGVNTAL